MTKYHISKNGTPVICRAKGMCPLGESYGTMNEVRTAIVGNEYDEIAKTEPEITRFLTSLADKEKVNMLGLEYRLKSKDKTIEKIVTRKEAKSIRDLYDVVRYTVEVDVEEYYEKKENIITAMEAQGYKVIKEKDTWNLPGYKGVNIKMVNPDNSKFELQFHTKESFQAKEDAHKLYEKQRLPQTSKEEREFLEREMDKIFTKLKIPKR